MVYEQDNNRVVWARVGMDTVEIDGPEWELVVPYDQEYGLATPPALASLSTHNSLYSRLALDKPWMDVLDEGKKLLLEFEEWVNRPSARGLLKLCVDSPDGSRDAIYGWAFQTEEDMPHALRVAALFPWADLSVDSAFYDRNEECFWVEGGEPPAAVRPWKVEAGEVAYFRIKVSLNEVGRTFLDMERYLKRGEVPRLAFQGKMHDAYEDGIKYRLHKKI
jgi:hypothetical protein